jgi:hypothetical protein
LSAERVVSANETSPITLRLHPAAVSLRAVDALSGSPIVRIDVRLRTSAGSRSLSALVGGPDGRVQIPWPSGQTGTIVVSAAPYAAMLVETLAAWGVRRLILVGWCGSLSPEVPVGSAVVPAVAWIEEGTSRHYLAQPDVSRPDTGWSQRLADACADAGATVSRGGVWTTDALFRESPSKVEHYRGLGAVAVDMEASAFFTVAGFLGVAAAAVLVVSDDLSTLSWRPGFKRPEFRRGCERACRAAAALALASVPPPQNSI